MLGYVQHKPRAQYLRIAADYENSICVLLAGLASEEVFLGSYSDGGSSDLSSAMDLARRMVEDNGMSPLGFAARYLKEKDKDSQAVFEAVDAIIRGQFDRAKLLLDEHRTSVEALADILVAKGTIDKDGISAVFDSI